MSARQHDPDDVALSLAFAVVAASPTPLLLLDDRLAVLAASASFCDEFGSSPADLAGQPLYAMAPGRWDTPELRAAMAEAVAGGAGAGEMDLRLPRRPTGRLVVQARRLAWRNLEQARILVAVSDVTDAQADAALTASALRQARVLLQEVRHRVANSLQIIASVLLQNARATGSDQTRGQLQDAHSRVMSVAALERMLSTSEDGDVEVHAYFTRLCANIAASLIGEADHVSLAVEGGDGVVEARVSVSLGLIVTELVINALKHAFPDGRTGRITVDYNFHGPNWTLCVCDDGVGMPAGAELRAGLGTSIVQALASQLQATVEVAPQQPGTRVSIHHVQIALVQDEPDAAGEPPAAARAAPAAING